jgi:hypothetical protein
MSVFRRSGLIGLQFLGVAFIFGLIHQRIGLPFWTLQLAGVFWFVFNVYRLFSVKCPHCDNYPFRGPLRYNPFAPSCRICGASIYLSRPAA